MIVIEVFALRGTVRITSACLNRLKRLLVGASLKMFNPICFNGSHTLQCFADDDSSLMKSTKMTLEPF